MTTIYILLAVCIVLAVISSSLAILLLKKHGNSQGVLDLTQLATQTEDLKKDISNTIKLENAMLTGAVNAQISATKETTSRFDTFMSGVDYKLDKMRDDNAKNLNDVRNDNAKSLSEIRMELFKNIADMRQDTTIQLEKVRTDTTKSIADMRQDNSSQLEKMRETVDEKLNRTLEQRFNQSFKIVGDRLEEINRSFADMQNLQSGVNDLKGIFKNIKTRGTWGEVALESLLAQILTEEQFAKQYNLSKNGTEIVDFVIRLPGKGDGEVLLPIDAKFPIEDYQRLVEASEKADAEGIESAAKAIEKRIKSEAQSIRDKYIKPPKTTDFAIMYLPMEGLFAEVIKRNGLVEDLQNRCRVVVCGPTTLGALLNSLQMGFRSVAIEKRSTEIGKLLQTFLKDFDTFSGLLQKTSKKLEGVQDSIAAASKRTEIISKNLNKVRNFSGVESDIGQPILLAEDTIAKDSEEVANEFDDAVANESDDAVASEFDGASASESDGASAKVFDGASEFDGAVACDIEEKE